MKIPVDGGARAVVQGIASQPMTIRRSNPRLQGLIGLGAAIDWFTRHGYFVAIPLNDSQPWDLVVEDEQGVLSRASTSSLVGKSVGRLAHPWGEMHAFG
jgi:hypothetical protein